MEVVQDFDLFVGGRIGTFKGVSIDFEDETKKTVVKNIQSFKVLSKEQEITALGWGDPEEVDVLIGLSSQKVKIYDTDFKAFTTKMDVSCGQGSIKGISRYKKHILTAVESGHVKVWSHSEENLIDTEKPIEKMKHNPFNCDIIATGGKENDLRLWNLEKKTCVFTAKNVPPDMLQLRVPVWVSDMDYIPGSSKVALCSRYGHVRLYDPNIPSQRRPVVSLEIPEETLTSMAVAPRDEQVVVGSGKGKLFLMDFRKKGVVQHYKGALGSIRSIACHKTEPYIVSVGLDSCLLVHDFKNKTLLKKVYMTSPLNCVLLRSKAFLKIKLEAPNEGNFYSDDDDDVQIVDDDGDGDDYEDILNNMEKVTDPEPPSKKKKVMRNDEET